MNPVNNPSNRSTAQGPMARLMASFGVNPAQERAAVAADSRVRRLKSRLPRHVSVAALEEHDPMTLLQIAHQWHDPRALDNLFSELLYQTERSPRPYDLRVLDELAALRDHVKHHVHGVRRSVWDSLRD